MKESLLDIGKGISLRVVSNLDQYQEGPVLVFLHEGLGSIGQWKSFPEELSEKLRLPFIAYDRYGYGGSTARPRPWPSTFMLEEAQVYLPALVNVMGIDRPLVLIGHSDGGSIALLAAARKELDIIGVVSIAMHVLMEPHTRKGLEGAREMFSGTRFRAGLEQYHGDHTDDTFYGWNDALLLPEPECWDIRPVLRDIECPVLVVQGDDDDFGTLRQVDGVLDNVRGSEALLIRDCGHRPHIQRKGPLLEGVRLFVRRSAKASWKL